MNWRYEKETQTVRTIPENYCVVALKSFIDGGTTDAALGDIDKLGYLIASMPGLLGIAYDVIARRRFTGIDQNPMGIRDLLARFKS
jgi:hypothetical protein